MSDWPGIKCDRCDSIAVTEKGFSNSLVKPNGWGFIIFVF